MAPCTATTVSVAWASVTCGARAEGMKQSSNRGAAAVPRASEASGTPLELMLAVGATLSSHRNANAESNVISCRTSGIRALKRREASLASCRHRLALGAIVVGWAAY